MLRLFVAIMLPPVVQDLLLTTMGGIEGARWVDSDQTHVTLKFIGEVTPPDAAEIDEVLAQLHLDPLTLQVRGVGVFEQPRGVDLLYAQVAPRTELARLHAKIDRALHLEVGLPLERRRFHPHVTLARCRSVGRDEIAGFLSAHSLLTSAAFAVTEIALVQSHKGPDQAHYQVLATYPLGVPPPPP